MMIVIICDIQTFPFCEPYNINEWCVEAKYRALRAELCKLSDFKCHATLW